MCDAFRTVAALRSALSARGDLLFEILALRHQLGVLARSDRRFRPCDRWLWLCLRRLWPRWREALTLVQPATVARWHREGFRGLWSRRARRRPGRPCIDSEPRALIRHMATANRLWGAPRLHGELLKLGFTVSERTVSRYLPDRRMAPSQSWRTFLANHLGDQAFTSNMTASYASCDDDVETRVVPFRPAPSSRDEPCASNQMGGYRSASLAPTHVSWLACRTRSAAPPTHAPTLWQGPADVVGQVAFCPEAYSRSPFRPGDSDLIQGESALSDHSLAGRLIATCSSGLSPCAIASSTSSAGVKSLTRSARLRFSRRLEYWRDTGHHHR